MKTINEKLKLVAQYMGLNKFVPCYQTDYNEQIPVWQKVCKELDELLTDESNNDGGVLELIKDYHEEVDYGIPLESFEILVTAIQFINNLKQK